MGQRIEQGTANVPVHDPIQIAKEASKQAGLRYVSDAKPGIRRKRRGKGFTYTGADGKQIHEKDVLARIKSLVIPPAWTSVWICPIPNGHLQATGRDARRRKQSRYHPRWREARDESKYEHMKVFGEALPEIRRQVDHDLGRPGLPREKLLATIVRLLETTFIRVGNEEYARENKSYGLTTMRNKHVDVEGATVHFTFTGKSGVKHSIDLNDRRLARIVKTCLGMPGYELFQYIDEEGAQRTVDAADVNDYLGAMTGQHFTAKDFRTWAGTVLACALLRECEAFDTESQAKKNVVGAIAAVAQRLGNTPSVCRKCYVHPAVIASYLEGQMGKSLKKQVAAVAAESAPALRDEEQDLLRLLERRLKASA